MTQQEKIIEMCKDGKFHCQIEFWNLFIRSPHKRRSDIEALGKYRFETIKCEHGVKNGFDYLMHEIKPQVLAREDIRQMSFRI